MKQEEKLPLLAKIAIIIAFLFLMLPKMYLK